jgi:hypothetical protein
VAKCQVWNGVGNAKREKMKAVEETHDKIRKPIGI